MPLNVHSNENKEYQKCIIEQRKELMKFKTDST